MTVQILQTEKLALFMQLSSRRDDYFVRARIFDETDAEIVGSPVALSHLAGGLYTDFSLLMPASAEYVVVQYEIYSDASFTKLVKNEAPDVDFFKRDVNIVSKLDQILLKLNGLALPGASMTVTVEQDIIDGLIEDVKQAKAIINRDPEIMAQIKDSAQTWAQIDSDDITAITECD